MRFFHPLTFFKLRYYCSSYTKADVSEKISARHKRTEIKTCEIRRSRSTRVAWPPSLIVLINIKPSFLWIISFVNGSLMAKTPASYLCVPDSLYYSSNVSCRYFNEFLMAHHRQVAREILEMNTSTRWARFIFLILKLTSPKFSSYR